MMFHSIISMCCLLVLLFVGDVIGDNDRPIIGVVAQSARDSGYEKYGDTFLLSSYVKFLQMAGARVVPIRIDQSEEYYEDIFNKLNGVLFPGGGANLETSGYAHVGQKFYNMAIESFDRGEHFPLWGTCNGFELLSTMTATQNVMTGCDAENLTLPLDFETDFKSSRLFADLPDDLAAAVKSEPITQNNHHSCLSSQTYGDKSSLKNFYRLISVNKDRKGLQFVSTMEGVKYPFYAVQYHPEKNMFNWQVTLNVSHSQMAVRFAQYLADFFVQEARKSTHRFPSSSAEGEVLIDNYQPVFLRSPDFHSVYAFNSTEGSISEDRPVSFFYVHLSSHTCPYLQLIGGAAFFFCGMLVLTLWLKSLFFKSRSYRRQVPSHSADVQLLIDVSESSKEKALLM